MKPVSLERSTERRARDRGRAGQTNRQIARWRRDRNPNMTTKGEAW